MAAVPGELAGRPVIVLKEGTSRTRGREAQRNNIVAARILAELMRTSLGPRGRDKMLVDSLGDVTVTSDGATILKEMEIEHPAAKLLVEIAKGVDREVGDGTTSVVVLAGELLRQAEELLDQEVHPSIIVRGYAKAAEWCAELLDQIAFPIDVSDRSELKKAAYVAVFSKGLGIARDLFAELAVDAALQVMEEKNGRKVVDVDQVQVVKKEGGDLTDTKFIRGIVIDKEVVHPGMPKRVENAKIALLACPLEIEKTEISAEIRITDPGQIRRFIEEEIKILQGYVEKIKSVGANVVFCQKGIDDVAQHYLAKAGILAVRRVKKSDMEKLARATGGRIVTNIEDLTEKDLGSASLVEERRVGKDKMVFVEGCANPRSVSVLIRGGIERVVNEAERSLHDALYVVKDLIEHPYAVAGGGAVEVELAKRLRERMAELSGKEQLAVEAFAKALEGIPMALAENGGHDPIDVLVKLRAEHRKSEGVNYGIDVYTGEVVDMKNRGIIEPKIVKLKLIRAATEAACAILRIDDIIAAARHKPEKKGEESSE